MKICRICGVSEQTVPFVKQERCCKPCKKEYNRKRSAISRDKNKIAVKRYNEVHKERIKTRKSEYYIKNKPHTLEKHKAYRDKNKEKYREYHLRREYGIGVKDYQVMLESQGFACAICKRDQSEFSKNLSVDHNHKTGKVRGLLCFHCNKFKVGKHNLGSARAVYEYLMKYDVEEKDAS